MKLTTLTRTNLIISLFSLLLGSWWFIPTAQAQETLRADCTRGVGDVSSLIRVINAANADPTEETIILGQNCIYTLTQPHLNSDNGLPLIVTDLIIEGNGATLQRDPTSVLSYRLLTIDNQAHVTLKNLTLQNGSASRSNGGAVFANPGVTLTLLDVVFVNNQATKGGAVYTEGQLTILQGSRFDNNQATTGGAVYTEGQLMLIQDSRFVNNRASLQGGGGLFTTKPAVITNTDFISNTAPSGGGLFTTAALTLTNPNFSGNEAGEDGGGLYSEGEVSVTGGRFESNRALSSNGGGLFVQGNVTLTGTKVVSNTAEEAGGGLSISSGREAIAKITGRYLVNNRALNGHNSGAHVASRSLALTDTTILSSRADDCDGIDEVGTSSVTMTGGQVISNTAENGGGLVVDGTLNMNETIVMSNTAEGFGGGVLAGPVLVENSRFENNQAGTGGGVFAQTALVENSRFENNRALSSSGGGLFTQSNLTLKTTTVISNSASQSGGGMSSSDPVRLEGNTFIRNQAQFGAGLFLNIACDLSQIANNLWVDNSAGGPTVPSIIFVTNNEDQAPNSGADIVHNTISSSNLIDTSAIAIVNIHPIQRVTLRNNIIARHATGVLKIEAGGQVTTDHNLYFGNTTNEVGDITSSDNLEADPLFVDPANGDFHLSASSLAIDNGVDAGVTVDLDGTSRPQGQGFDMGAFESGVTPPDPTPTPVLTPAPALTPTPIFTLTPTPAPISGGAVSVYLPVVVK